MDELTQARLFTLQVAERLFLAAEVLSIKAEKKPMKTTIAHGPEITRFDSFDDWSERGHIVFRMRDGGPANVVHVDVRGRICTRSSHYLRARNEETFPVIVYQIDGE